MIEEITGSVFDQKVDGIIHQANLYHTMGAGIARVIAQNYPWAYEADKKTIKGDLKKLGKFTIGHDPTKECRFSIINLYSQTGIGGPARNTRYDHMVDGLTLIRDTFDHSAIDREGNPCRVVLGIPHGIGSDLAGGDWRIVKAIIYAVFEDAKNIDVLICKLPGKK